MNWTERKPTVSGVYWYLDHFDQLAEDISVVHVDLEAGEGGLVSRSGRPTAPLSRFDGIWCGPTST